MRTKIFIVYLSFLFASVAFGAWYVDGIYELVDEVEWQASNAVLQAQIDVVGTGKVDVADWQNSNATLQAQITTNAGDIAVLETGKVAVVDWQSSNSTLQAGIDVAETNYLGSNAVLQGYIDILETGKVAVADWQGSNSTLQGYIDILETGKVAVVDWQSSNSTLQAAIDSAGTNYLASNGVLQAAIDVLETGKVDVATWQSSNSTLQAGIDVASTNYLGSNGTLQAAIDVLETGKVSYTDATYTDTVAKAASALQNVVEDLTPQAGGDLDLNGNKLTDAGGRVNVDDTLYVTNANVGIGTDSPSVRVHISSGNSGATPHANVKLLTLEGAGGSDYPGIQFLCSTNAYGIIYFGDPQDARVGRIQYGHTSDNMDFYAAGSRQLQISDNLVYVTGNLGIGTNVPNAVLEVNGDARYSDTGDMGTGDEHFAHLLHVENMVKTNQTYFSLAKNTDWDSEAWPVWQAPSNTSVTVLQVLLTTGMSGAATALVCNVEERTELTVAGTDMFSSDTAARTNGTSITSFANAGIAADAHLVLTTEAANAETGTVDVVTGRITYTKDNP